MTNKGTFFDMKEAPFEEIPVPEDCTDNEAIVGRKRLQEILDKHPAVPATFTKEQKNKKQRRKLEKKASK